MLTSNDKIPGVDRNGIPATASPFFDHPLIPKGSRRLALRIEQDKGDGG